MSRLWTASGGFRTMTSGTTLALLAMREHLQMLSDAAKLTGSRTVPIGPGDNNDVSTGKPGARPCGSRQTRMELCHNSAIYATSLIAFRNSTAHDTT